ncbi:unnamed protein product, partial [Scytosiphon promiscuus]
VPKGNYRWDSATAGEDNARADYGPSNEGYASLAWLPGQDSSSLVLLAGTSFKLLKMVDARRGGGVGGGAESDDTLRGVDNLRSIEAHKGAVSGIAVLQDDPRVVATWSDSTGVRGVITRALHAIFSRDANLSPKPVATLRHPDKTSFVVDSPSREELTKHPISKVSWQPPRVRPRIITACPLPQPPVPPRGGGGGDFDGGVAATTSAAEDKQVAVTFPQRMLTANSTVEGPFVENIGPWFQVKAIGTSAHGDVGHAKGFRLAEGNPERSGLMTRLSEDAAGLRGKQMGQLELASVARRRIATSGNPPLISEVMKWRAQAQYRTDAVYNRDTIFDEEMANQVRVMPYVQGTAL